MGTYTIYDGTEVDLPNYLTREEADNIVARAFPWKAAEGGGFYDVEHEYNLQTGVRDTSLRWGAAVARGNADEIAAEMDTAVGEGNWGFSEWGEPYITANGMRVLGLDPEDERKVMLDGAQGTRYDLLDIAPEVIIGGVAVAAELATKRGLPVGPPVGPQAAVAASGALRGLTRGWRKILGKHDKARSTATAAQGRRVPEQLELPLIPPELVAKGRMVAALPDNAGIMSRIFARAFSPSLVMRSARAGVGTAAASMGLQKYQELYRKTQRESLGEQLAMAGLEGVLVGAGSVAIGMPLHMMSGVINRAGQYAQRHGGSVGLGGIKQRQQSMLKAEEDVMSFLRTKVNPETGKTWTDAEISDIMPLVTFKEMFGPEGGFMDKYLSVLEGMGVKQKGDAYAQRTVEFLRKVKANYDDIIGSNLSPDELGLALRNQLTKQEQKALIDAYANYKAILNQAGTAPLKTSPVKPITELIELLRANIIAQFKHGQDIFKGDAFYGGLKIPQLSDYIIPDETMVGVINNAAKEIGKSPEEILAVWSSANGQVGRKIREGVEVQQRDGFAELRAYDDVGNPVRKIQRTKELDEDGKPIKDGETDQYQRGVVTANDLFELDKSLRQSAAPGTRITPTDIRTSMMSHESLMGAIDDVTGGISKNKWGAELARVNSLYRNWVRPFDGANKYLSQTGAQSVEAFVQSLITGVKQGSDKLPITFSTLMSDLGKILRGIEGQKKLGRGQVAKEVNGKIQYDDPLTVTDFTGLVSTQFMHSLRKSFKLTDEDFNAALSSGNMPAIRGNARELAKKLEALEKLAKQGGFEETATFNQIFGNAGFEKFKEAVFLIRDGDVSGYNKLAAQRSFAAAQDDLANMSSLWNTLDDKAAFNPENLVKSAELVRTTIGKDMGSKKFYNLATFNELYQRFLATEGLSTQAQNTKLRNLGEAVFRASKEQPTELKLILGEFHDPMVQLATLIRGAHNIDPTAGAISAAGLPIASIRGALNTSLSGVVRPLSLMFTMKAFAPGGAAWNQARALRGVKTPGSVPQNQLYNLSNNAPANVQQGIKAMQKHIVPAANSARKSVDAVMSGRNGLYAMSMASFIEEINASAPLEDELQALPNDTARQVNIIREQAEEKEYNKMAQSIGRNLIDAMSGLNKAQGPARFNSPVDIEGALGRGRSIANSSR